MAEEKQGKKKFRKKWLHKYRLVILNEETFQERLSLKLTRLNVFVIVGLSIIFLIILTTVLIAFTPLREYIPGYASPQLRQKAIELTYRMDSLENRLYENRQFYQSFQKVLKDDFKTEDSKNPTDTDTTTNPDEVNLSPSKSDSILRNYVAQKSKYNLPKSAILRTNYSLFPPVKGYISQGFEIKDEHYGIDIVAKKGTPIKSVADGTVVFTGYSVQTGYTIIIEHSYGLISVYKHNASLVKEQGDLVKAGEVIATVGSTGKFTTGPHLHFELWSDGYPMNPTDFISFSE